MLGAQDLTSAPHQATDSSNKSPATSAGASTEQDGTSFFSRQRKLIIGHQLHCGGPMSRGESIYFLGTRFDGGSIDEAVRDILAETHGRFKYVVTPNVHHMVKLLEDPATLRQPYEHAWRVFCDSRVLSRLAWLHSVRLPVITGSDLTARLIASAAAQCLTATIVGPTPADCAALASKYPGLNIVLHTPPMGFIAAEREVQKCVEFVVNAQAPLVFLAVGMPQQEILARHIADHPQAKGVGLCIGASIDFLTGKQRRAPVWVQKAGLEWLHRLLSNPRRLASRYLLECPRILYLSAFKYGSSSRQGLSDEHASLAVGGRQGSQGPSRDSDRSASTTSS
jgi:N-acetylglucosaminyldiphosphoundecaprenol N-acetyl-beta-D-mannosaminyltransferase